MIIGRKKILLNNILCYLILGVIGISMIYPFIWILVSSFREQNDISFFPVIFDWYNYVEIWTQTNAFRWLLNSVFVTLCVVLAQVTTSAMAAYAFSRLHFKGRDSLFLLYLSTMMVPYMVVLVPRFILFRELGILDTYMVLILPPAFSAYGTFMLRQFFLGIDRTLEEAAIIDGCNHWQIFINVILPLSRPALATLAIFSFIGTWRAFINPLLFTNSERVRVLPLGLYSLSASADNLDWGLLMTVSIVMIIPMILIFFAGQKHFMSGIRMGGVKG